MASPLYVVIMGNGIPKNHHPKEITKDTGLNKLTTQWNSPKEMEFTQRDTENKTQVFLKNHSLSWFIHGSQLTIYIAYQGYRAKNSPVNGIHPKRYKE